MKHYNKLREHFRALYAADQSISDRSELRSIQLEGEVIKMEIKIESQKVVEDLMEKLENLAYISSSPHTGEPISSVRLTDIYGTLCEYYGVDPKETGFNCYA